MKTLLLVQPIITSYRIPILSYLHSVAHWDIDCVASVPEGGAGFKGGIENSDVIRRLFRSDIRMLFSGRVIWQTGVLKSVSARKYDAYWLCANPRDLSFWLALLFLSALGRTVYCHGQGAYDKSHPSLIYKLMYRLMVWLSSGYIAYTELSKSTLVKMGVPAHRVFVADNTVELCITVPPDSKDYRSECSRVIFVGRLRDGCGVDLLINALSIVRSTGADISLDVVGDGVESSRLRSMFDQLKWVSWHGAVYEEEIIAKLSEPAIIGCYPGDAGLSVVQYMGLSLVPVVHDKIVDHQGPEPSYVLDGVNGRVFNKSLGAESLARVICEILVDRDAAAKMAGEAWATYKKLSNPPIGKKFDDILSRKR